MFCAIVVGRQVTVEAKKKKPQAMCFFWGGAAMCVFMDLNEKQRISQREQKYCYPPKVALNAGRMKGNFVPFGKNVFVLLQRNPGNGTER